MTRCFGISEVIMCMAYVNYCGCGPSQFRPFGLGSTRVHRSHLSVSTEWVRHLTSDLLGVLRRYFQVAIPVLPPSVLPVLDPPVPPPGPCVFCLRGDNAAHHWLIFCTFTHSLLSLVLGRLATPHDWYPRERKALVCVAHTQYI